MQRLVLVWMVTWVSVAAADKPPPPKASPGGLPTRALPCVMDDPSLEADNTDPVVCWPKGCMKLDVDASTALAQSRPQPTAAWLDARPEVKPDRVCLGATCKKLGKKLAAAVAAESAKKPGKPVAATTDLAAVVIGDDAWSVAADRRLKLREPKVPGHGGQTLQGVHVAGAWLVTEWIGCAGPCTQATIVDSRGKNRGKAFDGGGAIWQLSKEHFAVVSEYSNVHVFELATGKLVGDAELHGDVDQPSDAVRTFDNVLAVLYAKNHMFHVSAVSVEERRRVSVHSTMHLPACTPP